MILSLETSTRNCSVAISHQEKLLALVEQHSDQYIHSEKLHLFIEDCLQQAGVGFEDLQAVAVGRGPGSYTGLRIGVSAAKGICYARQLPLLSADGLEQLVVNFLSQQPVAQDELIIPMLDARRMEVYCSVHQPDGTRSHKIEARVIDEESFADLPAARIHLIGDAVAKCRDVLPAERFLFHDLAFPSAASLAILAEEKFAGNEQEDLAYFEPFYLKDFVAGKPRKLL